MGQTSDDKSSPERSFDPLSEPNMKLLIDTIEEINRTEKFKSVLTESMESVRLVMNSEASSLILLDDESGELFVSMPTGSGKMEAAGKRIPKSKGVSGWVAQNRQPYVTNDAQNSELFYGEIAEGFRTRNMICVPLINMKNEVIGVLQALNRRGGEAYSAKDVPVLQALASHISVAVERVRMIDSLKDRIRQKETFITDIHRRIMDDLETMAGMIDTEMDAIKEENARRLLNEISLRLETMMEIQRIVYDSDQKNYVNLGNYIMQLSDKIEEKMRSFLYGVVITTRCENVQVTREKALLCGLILNELLISIYKYAFRNEEIDGRIDVNLTSSGNKIDLRISDNGIEFPEDFNLTVKEKSGTWLVDEWLKRLGAHLSSLEQEEVRFSLQFKS
ncbi:MAG: GAF domain-containing protein [Balneolaceae bacterium]